MKELMRYSYFETSNQKRGVSTVYAYRYNSKWVKKIRNLHTFSNVFHLHVLLPTVCYFTIKNANLKCIITVIKVLLQTGFYKNKNNH